MKNPLEMWHSVGRAYGPMIGKTIKDIRPLSESEMKRMYWDQSSGDIPVIVIFTDGSTFIPMQDPEGNGPGFMSYDESQMKS